MSIGINEINGSNSVVLSQATFIAHKKNLHPPVIVIIVIQLNKKLEIQGLLLAREVTSRKHNSASLLALNKATAHHKCSLLDTTPQASPKFNYAGAWY
ncbi:hypothetical protein ACOSP7_004809 [Xanthoceras sorbifolium]